MNNYAKKLYESPRVEVIEIQVQAVVCQSSTSTGIDDMTETNMDINF